MIDEQQRAAVIDRITDAFADGRERHGVNTTAPVDRSRSIVPGRERPVCEAFRQRGRGVPVMVASDRWGRGAWGARMG